MIKIENLSKAYGDFLAIDRISLQVETGEIMGFLGPNGAGKTTTMKILANYMPPTAGTAWINNLNIDADSLAVRRTVGYLPENNPLYPDLTVEETLRYIADIRQIPGNERAEAIKRVTGQCGLASVFYKPVGQLSKGFRQRVGLAQALIHEPTVLILDEPTVGLDPKQIMEIRELIKKLGKDRTVLLSTHILQEVQAICDKVTIIHKGKIVASDTPEKLQQKTEEEITGSIYAKISGSIKEVEEVLRQIPGVKKVSKQDTEKKNLYGYMISCDQGVDVRSEIVTTVASHNLKLYELTPQKATLENVFLELTK